MVKLTCSWWIFSVVSVFFCKVSSCLCHVNRSNWIWLYLNDIHATIWIFHKLNWKKTFQKIFKKIQITCSFAVSIPLSSKHYNNVYRVVIESIQQLSNNTNHATLKGLIIFSEEKRRTKIIYFSFLFLIWKQKKNVEEWNCDLCNHVVTNKWILPVNKYLSMYPCVVM